MEKPEQDSLPLGYEQPDLLDRLLAFLLAVVAGVAVWLFSPVGLHPLAWNDAALAAGLMPPETATPGVARLVMAGVFQVLGVARGMMALSLLGAASAGLLVALVYLSLREFLPAVLSLRSESTRWTFVLERLVAAVGALVFLRAEPVWRLAQTFSAQLLLLVGTIGFLRLFLRLLHYGRFSTAYACLLLLGALAAESPLGLLLAVFALVVTWVARSYSWRPDLRYLNPMLMELSKWRLSLFFVLGFLLVLGADAVGFVCLGGLAATEMTYGALAVDWIVRYGLVAWRAATPLGWILILIFAVLPFGVAALNARRATDDDAFLPFRIGILFVSLAIVSLAPLSTFPNLRFWVWTRGDVVASPSLLGLISLALAVVFALALAVFLYDIWCRDHKRIALQRFPELIEDGAFAHQHFHWRWRKTISAVTILLVAVAVWPGRREQASRGLAQVLDRFIGGTVQECAGAKAVVTDGSLDAALRLAAAAKGDRLLPLSMMAGRSVYERHLRLAAAVNEEEQALLALGTADALKVWAQGPAERLGEVALQLGFEMWRNRRGARPPAGGFTLRTGAGELLAAGTAEARELARQVADLQKAEAYTWCEDGLLREKFLFAQWRLARIAAVRAEDEEAARDIGASRADAELATELDDLNPELKRIRDAVNWLRSREGDSLTPREGLRIALERADFQLARRYATPILHADPSNPDANFGMGMSYFIEEKYTQAEPFLKAALERRPDEPAYLNNLAVCCYKDGRFGEALVWARKALAKLPDSPAVRKTHAEIAKAVEGLQTKGGVE